MQLVTSFPAFAQSVGLPGLAVTMILIGLGTGGIKAAFPPFLAEQHRSEESRVVQQANGEKGLIDSRLTLQLIYNAYYACA